jgi:predicted peroxiredoxin
MFAVAHRCGRLKISGRKETPDVARRDFAAVGVGVLLDDAGKLDLKAARHDDAVLGFHQVGDAALARLAVDADHRVVAAAEVGRVDREVGN